ncbi:MAG: spermidine synthase [Isosphaeraceae bacterium]
MKSVISVLFGLTSFLGAVLLFTVEPMIGKMALPLFGGTPAVWNMCLVYFQVILLCGYAFSAPATVSEDPEVRRVSGYFLAALTGLFILGDLVLPIRLSFEVNDPAASSNPATVLLAILCRSTALPLFLVAATSPLVQRWFAETGHPQAHDPYFLYAASNTGSLAALLCYPSLIEPNLSLAEQTRVWRSGFLMLGISILVCGLVARHLSRSHGGADVVMGPSIRSARPNVRTWLRWLVLVFIPSSWLMGVTTYLTTDLAAMPLLWVIPLALYLLSFIIAFARSSSGLVRLASRALPLLVLPLVLVLTAGFVHAFWIPLHLLVFLAGAVACHGALAHLRPPARSLSTFYVAIAVGGLLGGIFNALIAPLIFSRVIEYPMVVVLACLVAPGMGRIQVPRGRKEWFVDLMLPVTVFVLTAALATNQGGLADSLAGVLGVMAASGLGLYACVTAGRRPSRYAMVAGAVLAAGGLSQGPNGRLLHIERNFYGVVRVTEDRRQNLHRLFHGSTLHGQQSLDPSLGREPSTYFTRSGPIGQLFLALGPRLARPGTRLAVVGLGAGTLATYALPAQDWCFYEIDPAIERIARDPRFFTYLRDSSARSVEVVLGDARLRIREAPEHAYQLIILDAFSSDSLPVHLITREAIRLYRDKLAEGGVLAFNLSNRYLDLDPVMGRQAEDAGLVCRIRYDTSLSPEEQPAGKQPSIWAVMGATDADLGTLAVDSRWRLPALRPRTRAWTDDYSDLTRYLHWMPRRLGRKESPGS